MVNWFVALTANSQDYFSSLATLVHPLSLPDSSLCFRDFVERVKGPPFFPKFTTKQSGDEFTHDHWIFVSIIQCFLAILHFLVPYSNQPLVL